MESQPQRRRNALDRHYPASNQPPASRFGSSRLSTTVERASGGDRTGKARPKLTLSYDLQTPSRALPRPAHHVNGRDPVWFRLVLIDQRAQGRGAELVGAAEEDAQRVMGFASRGGGMAALSV